MTHISKQQLEPEELKKLFEQLSSIISILDKSTSQLFLKELFGPEETIMIAKRLAAIVMFIEGNSSYRVWQLLHMSPSTAERLKLQYEHGRYKNIEKILHSNKIDYEKFWKILETILQAGMPPRGRGRWKSVFGNS